MLFSPFITIFALATVIFQNASAQLSRNKTELLNWCLNSTLHKLEPGQEDSLHQQCSPWKDKACCTSETTVDIHEKNMHNFNLDHCFEQKQVTLSKKCRTHFMQDNCFYECEPHIGLWVVETTRKIAAERFVKVPLCASDCDLWFEACKDDFTCAFNWPRNFDFRKGVNYCKAGSVCETFETVYSDAKTFCENVWDHSWQYTPDERPCMRVWFNGSRGNPNEKTAEFYIDQLLAGGGPRSGSSAAAILLCAALFAFLGN